MEKYEQDTAWLQKNVNQPTEKEIDEFVQSVAILVEDMRHSESFARNYCASIINRNRSTMRRVNGH